MPTWVADFNPLCAGASVETYPGLAKLNLGLRPDLFNRLLGGVGRETEHLGHSVVAPGGVPAIDDQSVPRDERGFG
jgi:hypothetical protein